MDRCVRSLVSLGDASTSRVLNLVAIGNSKRYEPEYSEQPLFLSPVINNSILIKHRVRPHETYVFRSASSVATKIIVPFDVRDLRLGGRSFFVDQKGFRQALQEIGHYADGELERDIEVLHLIGGVPSLDPFLLREHLKLHQFPVANCYFQISPADLARMYDFAARDILGFIELVTGVGNADASAARLVAALLSNDVTEKLDPLRACLMMDGKEFREGVFSWRGFLYYKWSLHEFMPEISGVIGEIQQIRAGGSPNRDDHAYMTQARKNITGAISTSMARVKQILSVYDNAYANLIDQKQPKAFRDFLLSAPHLFLELGDKMGGISHIVTFWRYRFRKGVAPRTDADELCAIFQDFESGFAAGLPAGVAA
ncbi:MAG TPA: hypothetical protein VGG69_08705 [Rhizomicrobium sp.]